MKRTSLIGLLVFSLLLSACGGDDDKDKTTTTVQATTSTTTAASTTTSTTAAPAFTPAAVSGLQVWYRGDAGVNASSGKVRIWEDQSGNGLHASRPTVSRQPALVSDAINGHPGIRFDGTDDALAVPFNLNGAENASLTIFAVWTSEPVPRDKLRKLYGHDNRDFDRAVGFDSRTRLNYGFFTGSGVQSYFSAPFNTPTLTTDMWRPRTFSGYVNGVVKVNNAAQTTGPGDETMTLGGIRDNTEFPGDANQARALGWEPWQGVIAEFLIYDRSLTDGERQQVEQHLMAKYRIG